MKYFIRLTICIAILTIAQATCLYAQTRTLVIEPSDDARIWSACKNNSAKDYSDDNFGDSKDLNTAAWTWGGVPCNANPKREEFIRSYIQFDLEHFPQETYIESAILTLYYNSDNTLSRLEGHYGSPSEKLDIFRIENFDGNGDAEINEKTINWDTNISTLTQDKIQKEFVLNQHSPNQFALNIDVTRFVRYWINHPETYPNHGVLLQLTNERRYRAFVFASKEHPNPDYHPKLTIVYNGHPAIESISLLSCDSPNFLNSFYFTTNMPLVCNCLTNQNVSVTKYNTTDNIAETITGISCTGVYTNEFEITLKQNLINNTKYTIKINGQVPGASGEDEVIATNFLFSSNLCIQNITTYTDNACLGDEITLGLIDDPIGDVHWYDEEPYPDEEGTIGLTATYTITKLPAIFYAKEARIENGVTLWSGIASKRITLSDDIVGMEYEPPEYIMRGDTYDMDLTITGAGPWSFKYSINDGDFEDVVIPIPEPEPGTDPDPDPITEISYTFTIDQGGKYTFKNVTNGININCNTETSFYIEEKNKIVLQQVYPIPTEDNTFTYADDDPIRIDYQLIIGNSNFAWNLTYDILKFDNTKLISATFIEPEGEIGSINLSDLEPGAYKFEADKNDDVFGNGDTDLSYLKAVNIKILPDPPTLTYSGPAIVCDGDVTFTVSSDYDDDITEYYIYQCQGSDQCVEKELDGDDNSYTFTNTNDVNGDKFTYKAKVMVNGVLSDFSNSLQHQAEIMPVLENSSPFSWAEINSDFEISVVDVDKENEYNYIYNFYNSDGGTIGSLRASNSTGIFTVEDNKPPLGQQEYYIDVSSGNCSSEPLPISISIVPEMPVPSDITVTGTLCPGEEISFSAPDLSPNLLYWYTTEPTNQTLLENPAKKGTVYGDNEYEIILNEETNIYALYFQDNNPDRYGHFISKNVIPGLLADLEFTTPEENDMNYGQTFTIPLQILNAQYPATIYYVIDDQLSYNVPITTQPPDNKVSVDILTGENQLGPGSHSIRFTSIESNNGCVNNLSDKTIDFYVIPDIPEITVISKDNATSGEITLQGSSNSNTVIDWYLDACPTAGSVSPFPSSVSGDNIVLTGLTGDMYRIYARARSTDNVYSTDCSDPVFFAPNGIFQPEISAECVNNTQKLSVTNYTAADDVIITWYLDDCITPPSETGNIGQGLSIVAQQSQESKEYFAVASTVDYSQYSICGSLEIPPVDILIGLAPPSEILCYGNTAAQRHICKTTERAQFRINEIGNAAEYIWSVSPDVIVGESTFSASNITWIYWDNDAMENVDEVTITVFAKNGCSLSDTESSTFTLDAPLENLTLNAPAVPSSNCKMNINYRGAELNGSVVSSGWFYMKNLDDGSGYESKPWNSLDNVSLKNDYMIMYVHDDVCRTKAYQLVDIDYIDESDLNFIIPEGDIYNCDNAIDLNESVIEGKKDLLSTAHFTLNAKYDSPESLESFDQNNDFMPDVAGVGNHTIYFNVLDVNNCPSRISKTISVGEIQLDPLISYVVGYCETKKEITGIFETPDRPGKTYTESWEATDHNALPGMVSYENGKYYFYPHRINRDNDFQTYWADVMYTYRENESNCVFERSWELGAVEKPAAKIVNNRSYENGVVNACVGQTLSDRALTLLGYRDNDNLFNLRYSINGVENTYIGKNFNPMVIFEDMTQTTRIKMLELTDGLGCKAAPEDLTDVTYRFIPLISAPEFTSTNTDIGLCDAQEGVRLENYQNGCIYSGSNITNNGSSYLFTANQAGTYTYTYKSPANSEGCRDEVALTMTVHALAVVSLAPFDPIGYCSEDITLTGGSSNSSYIGGYFCPLYPGAIANGSVLQVSELQNVPQVEIGFRVIDEYGCESSAFQDLDIVQPTRAFLNADAQICPNDDGATDIEITFNSGEGPWDFVVNGSTTTYTHENIYTSPFSFEVTEDGEFSIESLTDAYGCDGFGTTTGEVTQYDVPQVFDVSGGGTFCVHDEGLEISINGNEEGVTYRLFLDGEETGDNISAPETSFGTKKATGTYTVKGYFDETSCWSAMDGEAVLGTYPVPEVIIEEPEMPGVEYCATNTTTITPAADPTGGAFRIAGEEITSFVPDDFEVGYYNLYYDYDYEDGCVNTVHTQVSIIGVDEGFVTGAKTIFAQSADPYDLNQILTAPGTVLIDGADDVTEAFVTENYALGTHTLNYTYNDIVNGCTATDVLDIEIIEGPAPQIVSTNGAPEYCAGGDGIEIQISTTEAETTYQLYLEYPEGSNEWAIVDTKYSETAGSINFEKQLEGIYKVLAFNADPDVLVEMQNRVTIVENQVEPGISLDTQLDPFYCQSSPAIQLQGSPMPVPGISSSYFAVDDPDEPYSAGEFDPVHFDPGMHTVYYAFTNEHGCTGYNGQEIEIKGVDIALQGLDEKYCQTSESPVITAEPWGGTYYLDGLEQTSNDYTLAFDGLNTGQHTVRYVYSDSYGCESIKEMEFDLLESPTISLTSDPEEAVCGNQIVRIEAQVSYNSGSGDGPYTYSWRNGDSGGDNFVEIWPMRLKQISEGFVTVTDAKNCSSTQDFELPFHKIPEAKISDISGASCINASDGEATILFITENPELEYEITPYTNSVEHEHEASGAASNGDVIVNSAFTGGIHTLTMTDSKGCSDELQIEIPYDGPELEVICTPPAPCNAARGSEIDGKFIFKVTREQPETTGNYEYTIVDEDGEVVYPVNGTPELASFGAQTGTSVIYGLIVGNDYFVKLSAQDNGCNVQLDKAMTIKPVDFNLTITEPLKNGAYQRRIPIGQTTLDLGVAIEGENPCLGQFNDLEFTLSRFMDESGDVVTSATGLFPGLTEGEYIVEARSDEFHCEEQRWIPVLGPKPFEVRASPFPESCPGAENGGAKAIITGQGWDNIKRNWYDADGNYINSNEILNGQPAGLYKLEVIIKIGGNEVLKEDEFEIGLVDPIEDLQINTLDPCNPVIDFNANTNQWYTLTLYKKYLPMRPGDAPYFKQVHSVGSIRGSSLPYAIDLEGLGIDPGNFYVAVTDRRGCETKSEVTNVSDVPDDNSYQVHFRWRVTPEMVDIDDEEPDNWEVLNVVQEFINTAEEKKMQCLEEAMNKLENGFDDTFLSVENFSDEMTVSYKLGYHHYTLYYFDRAGNLVRTVPPAGVDNTGQDRAYVNNHSFVTSYNYNSIGQLVSQQTPDAGISNFIYNDLGQLRFSQNAQQAIDNTYSYTKYDALGRINEVGLGDLTGGQTYNYTTGGGVQGSLSLGQFVDLKQVADFDTKFDFSASAGLPLGQRFPTSLNNTNQQTKTSYTVPSQGISYFGKRQRYLLNRVSHTSITNINGEQSNTWYSYDPHGNVEWMVKDLPGMGKTYVGYDYDLISGNVRKVKVNEKRADRFFHKYTYDEDNRLQNVFTSRNGIVWDNDAKYKYFEHGPLKELQLGQDKIQKLDYTYTIQGWLKAINEPNLGNTNNFTNDNGFAKDKFGMALGYFSDDYQQDSKPMLFNKLSSQSGNRNLYNGNISNWLFSTATTSGFKAAPDIEHDNNIIGFAYTYDKLNRIKNAKFSTLDQSNKVNFLDDYNTDYTYDGNGNLLTLNRKAKGSSLRMDELKYFYNEGTNKLNYIHDRADGEDEDDEEEGDEYEVDISSQQEGNYIYDAIGNLISDNLENSTIKWNVYGKVSDVFVDGENPRHIAFTYDASGNRIKKQVNSDPFDQMGQYQSLPGAIDETYYMRDASGNIMSTYNRSNEANQGTPGFFIANYTIDGFQLYGSDRLGTYKPLGDDNNVYASLEFDGNDFESFKPDIDAIPAHKSTLTNWMTCFNTTTRFTDLSHKTLNFSHSGATWAKFNFIEDYYDEKETKAFSLGTSGDKITHIENSFGQLQFYATVKETLNQPGTGAPVDICNVFNIDDLPLQGSESIFIDHGSNIACSPVIGGTDEYLLFTVLNGSLYCHVVDMGEAVKQCYQCSPGAMVEKDILVSPENIGAIHGAPCIVEHKLKGQLWVYALVSNEQDQEVEIFKFVMEGQQLVSFGVIETISNATEGLQVQFSPDAGYLMASYFTDQLFEGPFSIGQAKINLYEVDEDLSITGSLISPVDVPVTAAGLRAEFSDDNSYLYYSYKNPFTSEMETRSIEFATAVNQSILAGEAGNLFRGEDDKMYLSTASSNNIFKIGPGNAIFSQQNALYTGATPLQNHKILPKYELLKNKEFKRFAGNRSFELKDHLGNVRAVVSDRKAAYFDNNVLTTEAELLAFNDYYPFGMLMPGRHYNADKYRFGFNGKEHDTEWKGTSGAIYDYGFRIYDAKIAKFLSVDPLTNSYPAWTPYAYAMNIPIACIDLDGLEALFSIDLKLLKKRIKVDNSKDVVTIVHEYSKSKIAKTHLSKDGLTQTQAEKLKSGGFWDKVGGALQYPGAAYYNNSLSKLYNITKKSNTGFTGGTLTWSFALQMEGNIKNQTERTVHAKKWRYSNTFLHFFGQTLGSAIFGEGAAKYSADIHERGWDGVYTGKGDDSKIVDAYVDLVNNEWGRKFGRELAEKYGIDESTVWTEELTGKFLNDVQDYFTKTFPALEFNDVSKKYIKAFTKEINKQLGHKSGSKSKDKQGG